jgi:4-amino-4-deoxy-L-arabinose transferase-like glycosyltransferase
VETAGSRGKAAILAVLAVLTLAGLGLRVGYAVEQPYLPPPDAVAYQRLAQSLSEHGSFDARAPGAAHEVQPSSAYAPGLPLLAATVFWIAGGPHLTLLLVLLAVVGAAAVPLTYLLGARLSGPLAGLLGAAAIAVYPALLQYQSLLLTEPLAATLLAGGLLSYMNAASNRTPPPPLRRPRAAVRWIVTGALFGLLALVRPEYLAIAALLPLVALAWNGRGGLRRAAVAAAVSLLATAVVLAPWTIRNAIALDRLVPISTGGGKALYIGTYLGADGDGPKLRELLLEERPELRARLKRGGALDDPHRFVLERVLARVAAEQEPGTETDAALGELGRSHLEYDLREEPLRFAGMLAGKAWETWTEPARSTMDEEPWRALQLAICALALAGLVVLAWRRRRLEALACGLVLLYMTAVGAFLIASPRRELVVLPLLAALAGVAVAAALGSLARRWLR